MTRKSPFKLPLLMGLLALLTLAFTVALTATTSSAAPQGAVPLQINTSSPNADGTEALPPGVIIETVIPNLTGGPVAMAWDPTGRLFFNDRNTGNVRLYSGGVLQPAAVIHYNVDTCSERGLLGLALDPNFTTNHYIYVYYTVNSGSACGSTTNRVARFVENNGVGSGSQDIFTSTQTAGNHNGGNIHFGQDGKLYITIGDNANAANSQDVTKTNGKIHRINPDGSIPGDNPVFTQTGALGSLYAFGVRNSFDFTIDPLTALSPYPRIFASENGPSCDDEMNRIEAGYNYGWRASYPCDDPNPSPVYNTINPLWYVPNGQCCYAPTGITVYTGSQIPEWYGDVFMATANNAQLRHFYLNGARTAVTQTNVVQTVIVENDLETGPDGALYYFDRSPYSSAANLKRITRPGGATATPTTVPPTATNTATSVPPTPTRTATGSHTPINTSTPTRTNTPVNTSTNTPTRTSTSTSTNTATTAPTQTPGGNTATPTPTNTNTAIPTATNTTVPATGTATETPVEPTATGTEIPPTPTVLPTATACSIQFTDVLPGSTFYPYIQCLACKGIIGGYSDGTFRPQNDVTRGQIAKIVANAAAFNDDIPLLTQTYQDVAPGSTFWVYVERLSLYQIVQGYACGGVGEPCGIDNKPYFRPGNNATRGQITKIIANAAGLNDEIQTGTQTFEDIPEGSTFHIFVERLLLNRPGVMSGYPCGGIGEPCGVGNKPYFRPGATATRGQLTKIVSNTFFPDCVDTVNVLIQEFAFHPNAVTVVAGTTVRFINRDLDYHTATADDNSFNTDRIYQNQFVDVTFDTPGSFGFYCQPHPYMRGTINVIPANK